MALHHRLIAAAGPGFTKLQETLTDVGGKSYGTGEPPPLPLLIGRIVAIFLGLLGVIFLILTVYGGYLWFMARGDERMVDKAKDTIKMGIIGLIIIFGAYAISNFVVGNLVNQTFAPATPAA